MLKWTAAFIVVAHAASTQAAPSFQIVSGGQGIFHTGTVSADGSTVLYTRAASGGAAYLFDVETGRHELLTGSERVFARAISGDGSIVRGAYQDSSETGFELANGSVTIGALNRIPVALSLDGSIEASTAGGQAARTTGGFSGTPVLLDDLPGGGTSSSAGGISADGSVIVGGGSSAAGAEAFRWEAGVTVGLGDLAGGGFRSIAHGVSADGTTVVGYGTTAAGREAFRWRDGSMLSLGVLGGAVVFSEALSVSADGSVIVGRDYGGGIPSNAFIWDQTHGMRRLDVVLAELGIDIQHVDLDSALAISSDGRTIVGTGFQSEFLDPGAPGGVRPGVGPLLWVAVIPEPSTALLTAFGLGVLASRRGGRSSTIGHRS